jgi:membrane protein YdbS with pleckstrin-like domain
VAGVTLWASWTEGGLPAGERSRRGVTAAAVAVVLVCACGVLSLGRAVPGSVQLVLMGLTAVALVVAVLVAPRPA